MYLIRQTCLLAFIFCMGVAQAEQKTSVYKQELKAFKNSLNYKIIFNEDAHPDLRNIKTAIENYQELTRSQRLLRFMFTMLMHGIVVTPVTMPKMYSYVDSICKQNDMKTPTIFLTTDSGFFNACACKLFTSTGAIIINQKLLLETSDEVLEAVLAHELGHIKYNHVNKKLAILIPIAIGMHKLVEYIAPNRYDILGYHVDNMYRAKIDIIHYFKNVIKNFATLGLVSLIINKRFEKEADEFAYKENGKGEGLIEFCEDLQQKEQNKEADFLETYIKLEENKSKLALFDRLELNVRYYLVKANNNILKWFYYNTPLGEHPSHEDRIKAAQEYLDGQPA